MRKTIRERELTIVIGRLQRERNAAIERAIKAEKELEILKDQIDRERRKWANYGR